MTKIPNKWQKEIVAWAAGEQIQYWDKETKLWKDVGFPAWHATIDTYRVKPEPNFYYGTAIYFPRRPLVQVTMSTNPLQDAGNNIKITVVDDLITAIELIEEL